LGVLAEAGLSDDGHAGVIGNLLQRLREVSQRVFADSAGGGEACDGPLLESNLRISFARNLRTKQNHGYTLQLNNTFWVLKGH
jgi:hypothetical protein